MNVIIANKYREMLGNLNIDVIKSLVGQYQVDDLINQFNNFFFEKMILDITAIANYQDIKNIQKISLNLDASKIILLLDPNDQVINSSNYLSKLVSVGIYNFTTNLDGINYLMQHTNSYKDVANFQNIQSTTNGNNGNQNNGNYSSGLRVIGFKNLTEHAGATSLIFMLKKELSKKVPTLAIEINKEDFRYFGDKEMISVRDMELGATILKSNQYKVILVDINDAKVEDQCNLVIHLLEPSTLKLNKMLKRDPKILDKIRDSLIVLNNSTLSSGEINRLSSEANIKIFYNIPPLNDRGSSFPVLVGLLTRLGIFKANQRPERRGLFKF
jgi:hypothetical protein